MSQDSEQPESASSDLPGQGGPALSLLRGVWDARGQTSQDIDESCDTGECRASESMGFDGLAEEVEPTSNRDEAITNLQSAWRQTLEREGKLNKDAETVRDMVLDSQDSDDQ